MTVAELISKLQEMPQDAVVWMVGGDDGDEYVDPVPKFRDGKDDGGPPRVYLTDSTGSAFNAPSFRCAACHCLVWGEMRCHARAGYCAP